MKFLSYSLFDRRSPSPRRFLSQRPGRVEDWLRGARDYVRNKPPGERAWLYRKPYDPSPGNAAFFTETYQLLNLLQAMRPTAGGRIVEVGTGPGWVTEILMLLGYEVDGIEPSEDMIAVAEERLALARRHYRLDPAPPVRLHATTLEDSDLPAAAADAVLFHESLHHVIDEDRGIEQCFRMLRPGGVLGVSEWAWNPGDTRLETQLEEEMARYGTLENPYSPRYLEELLGRHGFEQVTRFHAVNGFVPVGEGRRAVRKIAQAPAQATNNLIAYRPTPDGPTTADREAAAEADIRVLGQHREAGSPEITLKLRLTNTGPSVWLHEDRPVGQVRLVLRTDPLEACREATPRHALPRSIRPGDSLDEPWTFTLPDDAEAFGADRWVVDLVSEEFFWFSTRGSAPAPVEIGPG